MLQTMRAKAQGMGSKVLVWLVIFALSAFGFGFGATSFFQPSEPLAASVNGEDITLAELEREVRFQTDRLRAQLGDEYADQLDPSWWSGEVLASLVRRTLVKDYLSDLGLVTSGGQIDQQIVTDPAFMLSDQFSPELFRQQVSAQGMTPEAYRQTLSDSLSIGAFEQAVQDSAFLTPGDVRRLANLALQTRDIAWLEFDPSLFIDQVGLDDEMVSTAYELRLAEFMTEPRIDALYVEFLLEDMAALAEFEPDEDMLREAYQSELSANEVGEQRDASHILLEVSDLRSEAAAIDELINIRDRVLAGESFEEFAEDRSDDPGSAAEGGSLGLASRGVYVEPFEKALWNLEVGDISEPVVSDFGVHLIRLNEIVLQDPPSFEERRAQLESELRRSAARDRFSEVKLRADELAFDAQNSLTPLLEEFSALLGEVKGVTRNSGDGIFSEPALREALFASDVMNSGFNSPLIEAGADAAYVVRAGAVHAAAQIPFEDVRETLRQEIQHDRAAELASEAATHALSRMRAGEGPSRVALDGQEWERRDGLQRSAADVPAPLLRAAFELPRPRRGGRSREVVELAEGAFALLVVSGVEDGDTAEIPQSELQSLADQMEMRASQRDQALLLADLRDAADIESELIEF